MLCLYRELRLAFHLTTHKNTAHFSYEISDPHSGVFEDSVLFESGSWRLKEVYCFRL